MFLIQILAMISSFVDKYIELYFGFINCRLTKLKKVNFEP